MVFSDITFFLTAVFLLLSGLSVFLSYSKNKQVILRDFGLFLLGLATASSIWGLGSALTETEPTLAGYSYPLGVFFGGMGLIFFNRVGMHLTTPRHENQIFTVLTISTMITSGLIFFDLPKLIRTDLGVTLWNIPYYQALGIIGIGIIITTFNIFLFTSELMHVAKKSLKIRAILICVGLSTYMVGGLCHNIANIQNTMITFEIITTLGSATLLFAIFLPKIFPKYFA